MYFSVRWSCSYAMVLFYDKLLQAFSSITPAAVTKQNNVLTCPVVQHKRNVLFIYVRAQVFLSAVNFPPYRNLEDPSYQSLLLSHPLGPCFCWQKRQGVEQWHLNYTCLTGTHFIPTTIQAPSLTTWHHLLAMRIGSVIPDQTTISPRPCSAMQEGGQIPRHS